MMPRSPAHRATIVGATVAMVALALGLVVVVARGAQVETPLALAVALLCLAAGRHVLVRDRG